MLFDEWPPYDVDHFRPGCFIFHEQQIDKVLHVCAVTVGNWLLFVLHDLEDKTEQVLCVKRML